MTQMERDLIRQAIDAAVRARRQRLIEAGELRVCSACGPDVENSTPGCKRCWDRHRAYKRYADPEWRERYRVAKNERRRRRREASRALA